MSRINPLYILFAVVLLVLISFISLKSANESLEKTKYEHKEYMKVANNYHSFKTSWGNSNNTEKKIESILKIAKIQNANITSLNKTIKIEIEKVKIRSLDKFINKLLNEQVRIQSFSISKDTLILKVGK